MREMVRQALLCIGLAVILSTGALAQLVTQTALVGTVTDTGGGVLPGALVVAVNTGTQDTYETVANEQGYYNIQFVRPGRYEVSVTLAGFQTFRVTGIEVATNQIVRSDAVLRVGGLEEEVTVQARAMVLDTDRATLASAIGERAIEELPLSGRNVWNLASTTPNVEVGQTHQILGMSFRGAGQRNIQNSLSLDGISSSANLWAATSMRPIADAVTEVLVQTGSTSAEYGSYLGVHINVVTKSGTNTLHGSLFQYAQRDGLNARDFFGDRDAPKNPRRYNQFGFSLNGPVVVPGLYDGRNKTFFMGAFEGVRLNATAPQIISVPTDLMRQGNFSEIATPIRNPFTGQTYPGNIIPPSDISPIAQRILQHYPLANRSGTGANYLGDGTQGADTNQILVRVDQNIGNRVRLYGRHNWQDEYNTNMGANQIQGNIVPRINRNTLFAYTHTLSSSLVNDFRTGYHHLNQDSLNYFQVNNLASAGADLGIPGFDGDVRFNNPGIPNVNVSGFSGLGVSDTNWLQTDGTFQISNVLAYTRGAHNVRAGFDTRRMSVKRQSGNTPRGLLTFNGQMSGYAMADFILGLPREVLTPAEMLEGIVAGWRNGFFVNDTWQVRRNLTLDLGLRYELNTPVRTTSGQASMLDANLTPGRTDYQTVAQASQTWRLVPDNPPQPGFKFHETNLTNFAPRFGLAYRLGEKTVLRAGAGIYHNPNQLNNFTILTNNPPLNLRFTYISDPGSPSLSLENPSGVAGPTPLPNVTSPTRNLPDARKNQWSFDIQREIFVGMALDLQYLGSRTRNLDRNFFLDPLPGPGPVASRRANQDFGVIRLFMNDVVANYDAVTVALRRRMSQGLQVNAHYTWSRNRDMSDHSNAGGQVMNQYDIWADYARASWDVPHRFVANYIYELPFFRHTERPILRSAFGGWQMAGITRIESGTPFNVTIQGDRANVGRGGQRPALVGTPSATCGRNNLVNCIDASAFALPELYTFGNTPRNVLRGPGTIVTDLSLMKNFSLGGRAQLQFRAEAFNVFNSVNFNNPGSTLGTATFGRITSAQPMRQVQLGGRLAF